MAYCRKPLTASDWLWQRRKIVLLSASHSTRVSTPTSISSPGSPCWWFSLLNAAIVAFPNSSLRERQRFPRSYDGSKS